MSPEEIQEIKNYLAELYILGNILKDKAVRKVEKDKAEQRFIQVKQIIDTFSILWLGELIKMVEGEPDDAIHNRPDIT